MKTKVFWAAIFALAVAVALIVLNYEADASVLGTIADATCNTSTSSPIVPSSSTQFCVLLTNSGANAARIGDSNVGAARGAVLGAGTPGIVLCTQAPIYCYSASGTTINITQLLGPQ
jgi:hypothetical protein